MKLLYIIHTMSETIHSHIVDFLRAKGCHVDLRIHASRAREERSRRIRIRSAAFAEQCRRESYDAIIMCIHSSSRPVRRFQQLVTPRLGYIDLEHDLLAEVPEHGLPEKSLGVVSFHTRHHDILNSLGYRAVMARWYKLDATYPSYAMRGAAPMEDAVLIGSSAFDKASAFEHRGCFRKVWYKRFNAALDNGPKAGTRLLPEIFDSPRGMRYCADISRFHFTYGSGSYVDSLLFGSIPILYDADFSDERDMNGVVSSIDFAPFGGRSIAVTDTNLPAKMAMLRGDTELYGRTLRILRDRWFPPDYLSLPTTQEAIWSLLESARDR